MGMWSSSLCLEALGITHQPVRRIRVAHGCSHYLRYASDPSNEEYGLRRLPRPPAMGTSAEPPKKDGKLILSSDPIGSNGRKAALP
jgi:hypothetical protein